MHWYKDVRADFYEQLMSEVLAPHRTMRRKFQWHVKSGVRNEALDCTVMALHAARSVKVHTMTEKAWANLEHSLKQADIFAAAPSVPKQTPKKAAPVAAFGHSNINQEEDWI